MQATATSNSELFLELLRNRDRVVVELGPGPGLKSAGAIGIDLLPLEGVDIVHNLENGLSFIPDNSVDEITSSHVLEHISNFENLMRDIHRILKKGRCA